MVFNVFISFPFTSDLFPILSAERATFSFYNNVFLFLMSVSTILSQQQGAFRTLQSHIVLNSKSQQLSSTFKMSFFDFTSTYSTKSTKRLSKNRTNRRIVEMRCFLAISRLMIVETRNIHRLCDVTLCRREQKMFKNFRLILD